MKKLILLSVIFSLAGFACQGTGGTKATALQTFDAVYSDAVQAETLIIQETTTAVNDKAISPASATKVLAVTDSIKAVLDAANTAAQAGNSGLAAANVSQATAAIAVVSICLTTKPLTVQGFATCTQTLTAPQVTTS
jgi:hypothetical protein